MDLPAVEQYLKGLQHSICNELSAIDGSAEFETESWDRPEGGGGISRVLSDGKVFEKGGVNFSYVEGGQMPGLPHARGCLKALASYDELVAQSHPRGTTS